MMQNTLKPNQQSNKSFQPQAKEVYYLLKSSLDRTLEETKLFVLFSFFFKQHLHDNFWVQASKKKILAPVILNKT